MTEFYLVRHAQASFGSDNYDCLSDLGRQQSRWLGEYFAERQIDFSGALLGDLVRHRQTLDEIFTGFGRDLPVAVDDGLNEYQFDDLLPVYARRSGAALPTPGSPRSDYYRLLKAALHAWINDDLGGEPAESWADFATRVGTALAQIQHRYAGQRLLVISSGGAIATLVGQVLGLSGEKIIDLNMQVKNTGLSQFFFSERAVRLNSFNHAPHLDRSDREQALTYS